MRGGHVDAISRRVVAGWAADPEQPGDRLTVTITVDGQTLGEVVADRLRNDLASLGRFGDGRHGFSFEYPEPLDTAREHVVRVAFPDGKLLPNGEQRLPAAAQAAAPVAREAGAAAAGLLPVLVTAPGRSGTTLLMGLLARAQGIVAAELVPYELRLISYHAAAFAVLTGPGDFERSTHPDRLEGDGFHIGTNPFNTQAYGGAFRRQAVMRDFYDGFVPVQVAESARVQIDEFYRRLAADRGKTGVKFFAEKGNNLHKPTREFARRAFGKLREIVIVRDPRDVLCSHMAYFSSSSDKAFTQLSHSCRQLMAIRAEGRHDTHWLHYENMVRRDAATFAALSKFLGVTIEPDLGEAGSKVFAKHATSVTPEASVARWRNNLPAELKQRCATDWGAFLTEFGYALS